MTTWTYMVRPVLGSMAICGSGSIVSGPSGALPEGMVSVPWFGSSDAPVFAESAFVLTFPAEKSWICGVV